MRVVCACLALAVLSCARAVEDPEPVAPSIAGAEGATVTGELGQPLAMRCHAYGSPKPAVFWYRGRGDAMIPYSSAQYEVHGSQLQIRRLAVDLLGEYKCQAYNGHGKAATWLVVVRAYGSRSDLTPAQNPYLVEHKTTTTQDPGPVAAKIVGAEDATVTGELGQPLAVRCYAYGSPEPAVFWYRGRGDAMVPYSSAQYEVHGSQLQIRRLALDLLGEYECQAYNGHGKAATWHVVVRAYGSRRDLTPAQSPYLVEHKVTTAGPEPLAAGILGAEGATVTAELGQPLGVRCHAYGHPPPAVSWHHGHGGDGPKILSDALYEMRRSELQIRHLTIESLGQYECRATNSVDRTATWHVVIRAYRPHSPYLVDTEVLQTTPVPASAVPTTNTLQPDLTTLLHYEMSIPASCVDNPTFANCALIVQSRFCVYKYYSKFCCKSCVEAGQLDPRDALMQADQSFFRK